MGDPGNFNTVLQFCVKSIIEKIPKIQMGTPQIWQPHKVKVFKLKAESDSIFLLDEIKVI